MRIRDDRPGTDPELPSGRRAGGRAARLVDVAKSAEVSVATASRVLNGQNVDPVLAGRVRAAVATLGYQPNASARNLRRRETRVWAAIITDVTNPFHTSVVRGLEDVASQSGYSVLLGNSDEDASKERMYLRVAQRERVAGLVLTPCTAASSVDDLIAAGIPVVAVDRPLTRSGSEQDLLQRDEPGEVVTDTVMTSSMAGAAQATQHLLDHGWRRVACISGPLNSVTGAARAQGYAQVMGRYGLNVVIRHTSFSAAGGHAAATELLSQPSPPEAYFVANAALTLGVLTAAAENGRRIGHDIGLISFDDAPWAPLLDPPLTIVAQPAYELGATAGRLLLDRIRGQAPLRPIRIVLPTRLVERASCQRSSTALMQPT